MRTANSIPLLVAYILIAALGACGAAIAVAEEPQDLAGLERIEVLPPTMTLSAARAEVQVVVTGYFADGQERDVTAAATFQIENPLIANVEHARLLPKQDGETNLRVRVGSQQVTVPIKVTESQQLDRVRFRAEVLAGLTKQGCNAGSCHGSPEGKGGFALSLMAYAPDKDEEALIYGGLSRRVEPIEPDESLLLRKPLLRVPHVGGKRLRTGDVAYRVLRQWIAEGAGADPQGEPECTGITVYPAASRVLRLPEARQQLSVVARFRDGSTRDVTALATYATSNRDLLSCDAAGLVRGHERGVGAVSVRYLSHLQSVFFTVVQQVDGFEWNDPPENGDVDRLVDAKLRQLQVLPAEHCDDQTFIRRVNLDLTGLLPEADRARAFVADETPDKRAKLIDELLGTEEFARFWASRDADLMRVNKTVLKDGRAELCFEWLADSWRHNQPFDRFVQDILTATGDTQTSGPANYFLAIPNPEETAETTAQLFMGSRINCAKCHNHPFENWTQNDYYRIAAVFARTKNEKGTIVVSSTGEAKHPATGEAMRPWGTPETPDNTPAAADRRSAFAQWLTQRGNPFFARVEVNRIWAHLFGRGIVHPVDDFRSSNPPVNPELLDALAVEFAQSGYDRRRMIREICNCYTYQRAAATNRFNMGDATQFSHHVPRRLTAEQISDAAGYATRTLPPASQVSALRSECEAALAELMQRLPAERPVWEAAASAKLADTLCWLTSWRRVGPFGSKTFEDAVATTYPPETEPDFTFAQTYNDGKLKWQAHPEWVDGRIHLTLDGGVGPYYLARKIYTNRAGRATLLFGSNGSLKVWRNGELVLDKPERRAVTPGEDRLDTDLVAGENTLLLKIANGGGFFSFYFRLESFDGKPPAEFDVRKSLIDSAVLMLPVDVPPDGNVPNATKLDMPVEVAELVVITAERRSEAQQQALAELFESTHPVLKPLRDRVHRLTYRLDYHTQRPYPEQSPFLQAFGQPKRESPCACERTEEPTIDQELQLLNGDLLRERVIEGASVYSKFAENSLLCDELYWSALSRRPTDRELQVIKEYLERQSDRTTAVQDVIWALLNTPEFLFQH
jgi:hypothetical protein